MLALPTSVPTNAQQLKAALAQWVALYATIAPGRATVEITGEFPAMQSIAVELTDATLGPPKKLIKASSAERVAEASIGKLSIAANPIRHGPASIRLRVDADEVRLALYKAADGRSCVDLLSARQGHAKIETTRRDLEALAQSALSDAAASQGAKIERVELKLTQTAPRSAEMSARVTLKKIFFTAVLRMGGKVAVDDALNATVSGLTCQGDGAIGSIAANAITRKLQEFEGKSFPLGSSVLGNIRLRDVQFTVGEAVTIEAAI